MIHVSILFKEAINVTEKKSYLSLSAHYERPAFKQLFLEPPCPCNRGDIKRTGHGTTRDHTDQRSDRSGPG